MKGELSNSLNTFHNNSKINENNSKIKKIITENDYKSNNNIMKPKISKNIKDFKKLKLKTFLKDNENEESDVLENNNIRKMNSRKLINNNMTSKKNIIKSYFHKDKVDSPILKPKLVLNHQLPNKRRKFSCMFNQTEFGKKLKLNIDNGNQTKNISQYIENRQKKCKSSTTDAFKKRYKIFKKNFLLKKEINKKRLSFMIEKSNFFSNKDLFKKTFNSRNNILSLTKKNLCDSTKKDLKLRDKNIFKDNKLFTPNKNKIKNHFANNKNMYLFTERKSNNLLYDKRNKKYENLKTINDTKINNNFNTINSSPKILIKSNLKPKKSSNYFMNLQNENSHKSFNFNVEKKKKNYNQLKSIFVKNENKTNKELPLKKTTTINIYNNKINNINNIILNEKNVKNDIERKDNSIYNDQKQIDISRTTNTIIIDKDRTDEEKTENHNYKEDISVKTSSEENNKYTKRKSNLGVTLKDSKKKLSVNCTKTFLNQFQISRKKGKNINIIEKNIREKILKSNAISKDIEIKKNLKKIKDETTLILFEELIKKFSCDIEEGEKNFKKKNIKLSQKFIINEKNEYIKIVHKKISKTIKKYSKLIYDSKNKLIKIYERNISHYSKISINESKYFFFKYLYSNYFEYISHIIFGKKEHHKKVNNYNLLNIYNINRNKNRNNISSSANSSFTKNSENCYHSIFLQYLLMERDKIQKYIINNRYIDKSITQIKNLIKKAKREINVNKKAGDIKINFIVNSNSTNINNNINNSPKRKDNRKDSIQLTLLNIKKAEYSDTDRYDSKSGYDTRGIFPMKIKFNYKNINGKKEDYNNLFTKKKDLFIKKMTYNNEMFHSTYSNFLTNNNINTNTIPNKDKLEIKSNLEKKYNLALLNKDNIEKKYKHNITKNNDFFIKRKKNVKNKKKHQIIPQKKEINFLKGNYLFKNMIDYRTDEIKTIIKKNIKSPVEMLFYQIKEHDFDEFCELFERKQIDLNARNKDNDTFLIYAVKCKAMNFVLYLLKRGIDVNSENKFGNTALHYAFCDQNFELADVLLQHGADEFKINVFGQTPWQCLGQKKI